MSQWVPTNGSWGTLCTYSLAASGTNIFAGTAGGVYLSTNNGANWIARTNGLVNQINSLAFSGTILLAGTGNLGVFRSINNGLNWTQTTLNDRQIHSIAVNSNIIFAGTNNGVYSSINNGIDWTFAGLGNIDVLSLAISGSNTFAGTRYGGVFLSTNNGLNWNAVNNGLTILEVNSLAISGNNLFAGTYRGGVFLTTNNGLNWSGVNSGLTNYWVTALEVSGLYLFAGTSTSNSGVFLSTNNGATWFNKNQGFNTNHQIKSLLISNDYIFTGSQTGTYNDPVWRRNFSDIITTPALPVVRLLTPANGSTNMALSFQLDWADTTDAIIYQLQISVDSGFTNTVWDTTVSSSIALIPDGKLSYSTNYYWRVRCINSNLFGPYSSVWNFTTNQVPMIRLISPTNGITNSAVTPQFNWADTNYVMKYQIQVSQNSGFTNIVWDTAVVTSYAIIPIGKLTFSTNYYWRVRGISGTIYGPYSIVWNFTTGIVYPPSIAATLIYPENNSTGINLNANFNWNSIPEATSYRIKVATDSFFTTTSLKIDTTISFDSITITLGKLLYLSKYYWRVYGENIGGYGPSSNVWNFITLPPPYPILLSPPNGTNVPYHVTFKWDHIPYISGYKFQLAYDINFTNINYSANNILSDSISLNLQYSGFFWRVCAKGIQGDGPWSSIWVINVSDIHNITVNIPIVFKLYNNYPNPFNPATKIKFDVPSLSFPHVLSGNLVIIKIYDISGREIQTLVNEKLGPGTYETTFDGSQLTSGVYFYRLLTKNYSETKRMVLIK